MSVGTDTFLARYAKRDDGDAATIGDLRKFAAHMTAEFRSIRTEIANQALKHDKAKYSEHKE